MLGKITKSSVEKLPPGAEWLWDSVVKGFGARRQTDGVFYYIRYRVNGRQHVKSLGRHGSPLTPDLARNAARPSLALSQVALIHLRSSPKHWQRRALAGKWRAISNANRL